MSDSIRASAIKTPALVYVRGLRSAEAQIWFEPQGDSDYWRNRILAAHPLPRWFCTLTLQALKEIFPAPTYLRACD